MYPSNYLIHATNKQIHRYYAPKTHVPQENLFERSMNREKLSVWDGLCGNGSIIGPIFYENNLNSERYLEMLNNEIIPELMQGAHCCQHVFATVLPTPGGETVEKHPSCWRP